ncbi:MAG TPA: PPOX class F420-dependent oxidoreductase [Candidatus Limnocylindrales bacterium]|nr:PPOX class F420-dependent oxidoreductase [Candidatus Limnocylindrales bacterium]
MADTLSPAQRAFLEGKRFAALATVNRDGSPQQSAMWYLLEGDEVMFNTRVGRQKERNLRRDPRVSLLVVDAYTYVRVEGRARRIDDPAVGHADIRRLAIRYQGQEKGERQFRDVYARQERVSFRVAIERVRSMGV